MRKLVWFGWLLLWRLGPLIKNLWFLLKGRGERAIPIQQIQFLSINPINFIQLCWWIDGWWRNEWSWMEEWAQWARAGCLFFSFFSIQQSNSIKNIDWLQLNEEKKGRTAQPTLKFMKIEFGWLAGGLARLWAVAGHGAPRRAADVNKQTQSNEWKWSKAKGMEWKKQLERQSAIEDGWWSALLIEWNGAEGSGSGQPNGPSAAN